MKTEAQRARKRAEREKRATKETTWYCAGCKGRHPLGTICPQPRLFSPHFNRAAAPAPGE